MKTLKLILTVAWLFAVWHCMLAGQFLIALIIGNLVACALNPATDRLRAVTLSVPELMGKVMEAFKTEIFELFQPGGFTKDFSSQTAVLGDRVTAKLSHVPVTSNYDTTPWPNNTGFKAGAQNVTTLLEDIPLTLNQMPSVTLLIPWMSRTASKPGAGLNTAAVANMGYSLAKSVLDSLLYQFVTGNISNQFSIAPGVINLDTFDAGLRSQCNEQRMLGAGRFCFVNTAIANMLGQDDRTKSKLFYGQLQGGAGVRLWKDMAGFSWIREYPDFPLAAPQCVGVAGDGRLAGLCVRKIKESSSIARALGIPVKMDFHPIRDEATGLEIMGIVWQEQATGDVYLTVAILYGFAIGNQLGPAGGMTDNAGCLLVVP